MTRRNSVRFGLFLSSLLTVASALPAAGPKWETDLAKAEKRARELDVPILLHFYADWCGPCRTMERTVLNGGEVTRRLGSSVIGVKLNSDHNKAVVSRYNVRALPCDVLIDPSGRVLERSEGMKQSFAYTAMLDRAASRHERTKQNLIASSTKPKAPEATEAGTEKPAEPIEIAPRDEYVDEGPMLDGFSPVSLANSRQWIEGRTEFKATHKGQTYLLASAAELAAFEEEPAKYAPRLLGCDPVLLQESDRALEGSTDFGAFFDDHLFLFTSEETRAKFRKSPYRYTRTRHVIRASEIRRLQ